MPDHCIATNNKQKMHYNALLIVNIIKRILQQNKNTFAFKKKSKNGPIKITIQILRCNLSIIQRMSADNPRTV